MSRKCRGGSSIQAHRPIGIRIDRVLDDASCLNFWKNGRISGGSRSIARSVMNLWPLKPHAPTRDGPQRQQRERDERDAAEHFAHDRQDILYDPMPRLGAHLSIAGGLPRAVDRAEAQRLRGAADLHEVGRPVARPRAAAPRRSRCSGGACARRGSRPVVAHNSYLINLAAADPGAAAQVDRGAGRRARSRRGARARRRWSCIPGSYTTGTEARRADADRRRRSRELLRVAAAAAGRGSCSSTPPARAPTSATASSISPRSSTRSAARRASASASTPATCSRPATTSAREEGYADTFRQFGRIVGFSRLKAFHLNDSKKPCGSRVDRHEHIGKGCLGLEPFRRLLNDPRFAELPMLLETPKVGHAAEPRGRRATSIRCDRMNLTLAATAARSARRRRRPRSDRPARRAARHPRQARLAAGVRRNFSRSQPHSVATCGSSSPRAGPARRPGRGGRSRWRRVDGIDRLRAGRAPRPRRRGRRAPPARPAAKRGSSRAALTAHARDLLGQRPAALERADAAAQLAVRFSVTNAPVASGRSTDPACAGGAAAGRRSRRSRRARDRRPALRAAAPQ